jgi:MATE family multidrug resistance protein
MTTVGSTWRSHAGALLFLGLPIVGSHLAGFFIHVTDTVMLGWYGVEELAAVVLGGTFWFVTFILGSGFGSALPPIVAAAAAQGDERQIRRATRMAIWLTLGYAVLISPVFLFAEQILLAMGQVPEVAKLAGDYLIIAGWSIIPGLLTNLYRSYLSALQRTGVVLAVTVGGFFVHAAINWLLIFGNAGFPAMGIRGAAISTLITDASILLILVFAARRMFPGHTLWARFWRADREMLARVFALGWPIGLQLLAEVGLFSGAAVMMGWVSAEMLAAHGIALQLASTTFLVHLGLANAATIRTGQAVGLGDRVALRDGALTAVVMSVAFAVATMAVFFSIPETLMGLFLDPADPDTPGVIAAGVVLVTMAAVFQVADGGQAMAIGLLRGVQDTRVPMIIAVVGYWLVGLPLSYGLGFVADWGGVGVWTGLVGGLCAVWLALSLRFWGRAIHGAIPAVAAR